MLRSILRALFRPPRQSRPKPAHARRGTSPAAGHKPQGTRTPPPRPADLAAPGVSKPQAIATPQADTADPIAPNPRTISGKCYVIDGDTIVINKIRIRLAGIDCPELDQPWGKKAKFAMVGFCKGQIVTAHIEEGMSYDRVVARCTLADGTDLAAKLVEAGLALDWAKFSGGRYRHLEPAGVRKTLWRVAAKHRGKLAMPAASDP